MTKNEKTLLKKSMTKKAYLELQKSRRVVNNFNTGTRTFKTAKKPSRQVQKKEVRNGADSYGSFCFRVKLILYYRKGGEHMTVWALVTGSYQCEGCMNSYAEEVRGLFDSKSKAEKALEELKSDDNQMRWLSQAFVQEYEVL